MRSISVNYDGIDDIVIMALGRENNVGLIDEIRAFGKSKKTWLIYWDEINKPDTIVFEAIDLGLLQYSHNFILRNSDTIYWS